ncbi:MAG: phosphomevalonate kinase, partial [Planctomycetota bacterium]
MVRVSAPGKIVLAGEWAVLEPGNPAVVAAVDRRVSVTVAGSKDDGTHFAAPDLGIPDARATLGQDGLRFSPPLAPGESDRLRFLASALETVPRLTPCPPLRLTTRGDLLATRDRKIGFGSSAATVTGAVFGILRHLGLAVDGAENLARVFKLSALAHTLAQGGRGSGVDVAGSVYGGITVYRRVDPAWLKEQWEAGTGVREMIEADWPGMSVERLPRPEGLHLIVGSALGSASTPAMIDRVHGWKRAQEGAYRTRIAGIAQAAGEFIRAWKGEDMGALRRAVIRCEEGLRALGTAAGVPIESDALKFLCETAEGLGGAGKVSGAGGDEIGIAFCP